MAKRVYFRDSKGRIVGEKSRRLRHIWVGKKKFTVHPKARAAERKKVINRARKAAERLTFSEKISEQLPTEPAEVPARKRFRSEDKLLNKPGKNETFEVKKYYFELSPPVKITTANVESQIYGLMSKFWRDVKKVFVPGKNYLFRIDTAYRDKDGFARTDPSLKAGKDGLSDGRGYSMGRYLDIETPERLLKYLKDSVYGFLKSFETYIARQGIISGQINALTLEIS